MKQLLILILAVTSLFVFAQDRDKKATEILDGVVNKTNSYNNFETDFTYTMKNEEAGINESKKGTLIVEGDKYRLNIAEQIVICDSKTVWTFLVDDQEVMVNTVDISDESITPSNLLNNYNENYKSRLIDETTQGGKTLQVIELKPEEGKTYTKIEISVDKAKKQIVSFIIYDKNGSTYSYLISNFRPNITVSDTLFFFDGSKYPDVDIIDMR